MSGTTVNGREVLDHVRISEGELVREGWGEKYIERIRVLEPGLVQIWEKRKARNKKDEWVKIDEWATDLDYIPMVTFYTERQGLGLAKPPLLDLAFMNVGHWQLEADLNNIISVACFPMLAMSGVDDSDSGGSGTIMKLGPNQILATRAPDGKFYYVEHTGSAIQTGMDRLAGIEDQMAAYGAQFLKDKPGDLKATVRSLDTAEALSQLQAMTLVFKDVLELALRVMSDWASVKGSPSVEMSVDFGLNDPDEKGWSAIESARTRREISRDAVISEMSRRGWLSDDYDSKADLAKIEEENALLIDGAADLDLDPAQKDDKGDRGKKNTGKPDDKKKRSS